MMKQIFLCLILFFGINKIFPYSIVFIHLGSTLPTYLDDAITQAQLFNKNTSIYLISNRKALMHCKNSHIIPVAVEDLKMTLRHAQFQQKTTLHLLDSPVSKEFWLFTSERFLVLNDFMQQFEIEDIFHIENDTLIYSNLDEIFQVIKKEYGSIAAIFDSDQRCIPCFMYIPNKNLMDQLAQYFCDKAPLGKNDMEIIALFRQEMGSNVINNLPIIMDSYQNLHVLKSENGRIPKTSSLYSNLCDILGIFDGAALGQYFGGTHGGHYGPGFINESCIFDPSKLTYEWKIDHLGRKIPYATFHSKAYKINNLHIHCKKLNQFMS